MKINDYALPSEGHIFPTVQYCSENALKYTSYGLYALSRDP